jgi:glycosyltransferase involved in cell wall biosynthesis
MELRNLHIREKARAAKFVVTISEFGRGHLLRILGMEARNHVNAVHLGVDLSQFQPVEQNSQPGQPVHLVCVGRLVKDKAQDVLLEAMAKLVQRGVNARLTLVGNGTAARAFEDLSNQLGLQSHVKFTGALPQPQTQEVLRTADIFVLPSFAEGIPVALMEAMAMEIPCVSTTVMGIPELIRSGEDGVLVQPADIDGLADALQRLIENPELRRRLGRAARVKVAEEFNLDINIPRLHEVFRRNLAPVSQAVAAPVALVPEKKVATT